MNDVADDLAGGSALAGDSASMVGVQYAKLAGVIEGLARAERAILDVLDEIEEKEKLDT